MKTFRFIGVGLFAVLLSFTFTACGDDEEEDLPKDPTTENITPNDSTQNKPTEVPEKNKKLVKIRITEGSSYWEAVFTYNKQGRISTVVEHEDEYSPFVYNITYIGDSISIVDDGDYRTTNTLWDNKVLSTSSKSNEDNDYYQHNLVYDTHLINVDGDTFLSWEEDKLIKFSESYYKEQHWIYEGKTCKGYNPVILMEAFDDWFPAMAHPELIGMRTNYLPSSSSIEYYDGDRTSCYYTYKFDEDGYLKECVKECVVSQEGRISTDTDAYYFTWE
ncbi:MAG: hypothetical protein Q4F47_06145 [Bacteroidaceae bacterium]|nr:hypothetical protein [Bacteroidaceae bacterium]